MTLSIYNLISKTGPKCLLVLAFVICLLPIGAMAIVYVDSPMVIEEAGEYQLIKDITDYDGVRWQNGSEFYEPCIKILASDVIFDGNGHTISTGSKFNQSKDDQVGIYVDALLERVSVIDTNVEKFNYGIYYYVVNPFGFPEMGGRIDNNTVNNNDYGIVLDSSQRVSVLNNDASYTNHNGITVSASYWNIINNNIANNNGNVGILLEGSMNNSVTMNSANNNNDVGIHLQNSHINTVENNIANENINVTTSGPDASGNGILLERSTGNHILNNDAHRNRRSGISVYPTESSSPNWVENNHVSENGHTFGSTPYGWGIYVESDQGTTHVNNNHAFDNMDIGIELHLDNGAYSGGNTVEGNGVMGILLHGSKHNTLHNNTIRNNHKYGIQLATVVNEQFQYISSDSNNLLNNTIYGHEISGVFLNGTDNFEPLIENLLDGNDIYNNDEWGVHIYHSNLNTLTDNVIHANGLLGIKLDGSAYNVIYNNIFNNSVNAGFGQMSNNPNTWNVLMEPGPNLVGGPYQGGNYWAQPDGHGWSQINPDTKGNGFSDNAFVIGPSNTDNFPLTNSLKVSFTADKTSGDAPLTVAFAGNVAGQTGNQWLWNFGDNTTDTTQNPTHVYQNNGVYTVSLTASNGGWSNTTTKTGYIMVGIASPVADFSGTPVTGAFPLTVTFTDLSTPNSGQYAVTAWDWDFGDNTPHSIVKNPVHVYQAAGNYNVVLTVTNPGSSNTTSKVNYITSGSTPAPTAAFTMDPGTGPFPLSVNFIDQSTGSPPLTYDWDFGDNSTHSALQNPNHVYSTENTYSVTLTVSNVGGQSQVAHDVIVTSPAAPTAAFTMNPSSGPFPLTVNFIDQSTGLLPLTYNWEFGDGITSDERNPSYEYDTPGTYHVNLTVSNVGGQSLVTHDIVVTNPAAPTAAFTMNPSSGLVPLTVNFIDQSTGIPPLTYSWDFGDGVTSNERNPSYEYDTPGTYQVTLTVTNVGGTSVSEPATVVVTTHTPPSADFTGNPRSGTKPLTVQFIDLSLNNPTSWLWEFGDGNTSTVRNPEHTYYGYADYTVNLTATNDGGSNLNQKIGFVSVQQVPGPTASFTMDQDEGYVPLNVVFTDQSTGSPSSWFWNFGDGSYDASQNPPSHEFASPGVYTVTLTVTNNNGQSQFSDQITVNPKAWFTANQTSGHAPLTVKFTDQSTGNPTKWAWDFNGEANSTVQNPPPYTFTTPGVKTVSLNVTSNGRSDSFNRIISVGDIPLKASFKIEPELDPYDPYYAPANLTFIDLSTGTPNAWLWQFGDGTYNTTQYPVHSYTTSGNYTARLMVTSSTGGVSEYSQFISIYPKAIAEAVPTSGVVPLTVKFYDRSTGSPTAWYWEFGDGNNSTLKNPTNTFTKAGGYWISLTVTGATGLEDQTLFWDNMVEVAPRSDFTWYPTSGNEPLNIQFRDASEGSPNNFAWEFGDGAVSNEKDPVHIYRKVGNYTVNLTTDSWWGISNTSTKVISLSSSQPTAAFTMSPGSGPFPLTVNFIDQSSGSPPLTYDWDFGDGSAHSTLQSPSHIYPSQGTFNVALTVANTGGISVPVIHPVVVTNPATPTAAFTMSPGSGPFPLTVNFIDQSSGSPPLTYDWDFGDGSDHSTIQSPTHIYLLQGTYNVTLTVTNTGGPSIPVIRPVIVSGPGEPTVAFTAIPRSGTVPLMVSFLDQSTANPDTSIYAWDFGDGATSNQRNPAHQYATSGSYDVTLTVNVNGIDYPLTEADFIVVNPPGTVTADFFGVPPSGGIEPVVVQFYDRSTGTPAPTSWFWDFDDQYAPVSEKTSTLQSPVHTYTKAGNFTPKLTVSNSQGPNTKVYPGVIYVRHTTPVAAFNASPVAGYTPFSVTFTDKSNGQALLAWDWNFGDGGTSQTQSPVYTYNTPGTYSVTFKSYNDGGWSVPITKTNLITVLEAPPTPAPNIIKLYPGWNFVSTPKKLAAGSNSVNEVFANVDMDHHSPLLYNGETKSWVQFISGTVKPLDGIWVYSKYQMDVTLQFDTSSIPLPPSKDVFRGWNAIGETGVNPISARELLTQVGQLNGNWDTLIGINASTHQSETYIRGSINPEYSDLKFTFPTKGYWLQMNTDDTLEGLV